ncbi:MAG: hypothetical protein HOQ24_06590 [Mycobacteriaceae bacterium]|nr:hypothetical protein [Mycobacteriaceae bacterium]
MTTMASARFRAAPIRQMGKGALEFTAGSVRLASLVPIAGASMVRSGIRRGARRRNRRADSAAAVATPGVARILASAGARDVRTVTPSVGSVRRMRLTARRFGLSFAVVAAFAAAAASVNRWRHSQVPPAPAPEPPSVRSLGNGGPATTDDDAPE